MPILFFANHDTPARERGPVLPSGKTSDKLVWFNCIAFGFDFRLLPLDGEQRKKGPERLPVPA